MSASPKARVGVIGMAVMGSNLARNFARNGIPTAVYNRTYARTEHVMEAHADEGEFFPAEKLSDIMASQEQPRAGHHAGLVTGVVRSTRSPPRAYRSRL